MQNEFTDEQALKFLDKDGKPNRPIYEKYIQLNNNLNNKFTKRSVQSKQIQNQLNLRRNNLKQEYQQLSKLNYLSSNDFSKNSYGDTYDENKKHKLSPRSKLYYKLNQHKSNQLEHRKIEIDKDNKKLMTRIVSMMMQKPSFMRGIRNLNLDCETQYLHDLHLQRKKELKKSEMEKIQAQNLIIHNKIKNARTYYSKLSQQTDFESHLQMHSALTKYPEIGTKQQLYENRAKTSIDILKRSKQLCNKQIVRDFCDQILKPINNQASLSLLPIFQQQLFHLDKLILFKKRDMLIDNKEFYDVLILKTPNNFIFKLKNSQTKQIFQLKLEEDEGFRILKRFYFDYEEIIKQLAITPNGELTLWRIEQIDSQFQKHPYNFKKQNQKTDSPSVLQLNALLNQNIKEIETAKKQSNILEQETNAKQDFSFEKIFQENKKHLRSDMGQIMNNYNVNKAEIFGDATNDAGFIFHSINNKIPIQRIRKFNKQESQKKQIFTLKSQQIMNKVIK